MFNSILLATDGSDLSRRTIHEAIHLAKSTGAKIIGLAVAVDSRPYLVNDLLISNDEIQPLSEILKESERHVKEIGDLAKASDVAVEVNVVMGYTPAEEILKMAEAKGCDLIFMGSHGRHGIDKIFLGSEAQKVLKNSKIPVLIFK